VAKKKEPTRLERFIRKERRRETAPQRAAQSARDRARNEKESRERARDAQERASDAHLIRLGGGDRTLGVLLEHIHSDEVARLQASDYLEERGRNEEAALLRDLSTPLAIKEGVVHPAIDVVREAIEAVDKEPYDFSGEHLEFVVSPPDLIFFVHHHRWEDYGGEDITITPRDDGGFDYRLDGPDIAGRLPDDLAEIVTELAQFAATDDDHENNDG
jgi:hypothetical protein